MDPNEVIDNLDFNEFGKWLRELPDDKEMYACSGAVCPVAFYLRSYEVPIHYVSNELIVWNNWNWGTMTYRRGTPAAFAMYINYLDTSFQDKSYSITPSVSKEQAIQIWDKVNADLPAIDFSLFKN